MWAGYKLDLLKTIPFGKKEKNKTYNTTTKDI
jgi:hypothetical protein